MYSLLHHNTFGIDAKCREFKEYTSVDELLSILPKIRNEKWLQIGGGSNLLFVDDFEGTILHSRILSCEEIKRTDSEVWLRVGAGVVWDEFVGQCVAKGYYGLENLSLIPGEVGASAVQNIGAYGVEAGQRIDSVETVEVATGKLQVFSHDECEYAYRSSVFKHALRGQYIVTHVVYRLSLNFSPDLDYGAIRRELESRQISAEEVTAGSLRQLIIDVRRSKLPDPEELGSAGSFFMNPVVSQDKFESLLKQYPQMPHFPMTNGVKIPAGWMIEQCGWKGKSLGAAGVYSKQALVLVNLGGATGQDIVRLSDAVRQSVKEKFGIDIHPEANFIE